MTTGDWLITALGGVTALLGLTLIAWALLADRFHTRHARRKRTLRRCPRCWYDMLATEGLTCPECGRKAKHERRLHRARRRNRLAALGSIVVALGALPLHWTHGDRTIWYRALPSSVLVRLVPHDTTGGALNALADRLKLNDPNRTIRRPDDLSPAQWSRLTRGCSLIAFATPPRPDSPTAKLVLGSVTRTPTAALPELLRLIEFGSTSQRAEATFMLIEFHYLLTDDELKTARDLLAPTIPTGQPTTTEEVTETQVDTLLFDEQIRRGLPDAGSARQRLEQLELTPEAICTVMARCTRRDLAFLRHRLGVPTRLIQPALGGWAPMSASPLDDPIRPRRRDLDLDGDGTEDCVIRIGSGTTRGTSLLFFLRRAEEWRFEGAADMEGLAVSLEPWDLGGKRFLRVETRTKLAGYNAGVNALDYWLTLDRGRLELLHLVQLGSKFEITDLGMMFREFECGEPTPALADGKPVVRYNATGTAAVNVPDYPNSRRIRTTVWKAGGVLELPLDPGAGSTYAGARWGGRDPYWLMTCPPEEILGDQRSLVPELLESAELKVRLGLSRYIRILPQTPELLALRDSLTPESAAHPPDRQPPP